MSLSKTQQKFTLRIAEFIIWAYGQGYTLTFGDAYRDPRLHGPLGTKLGYGHKNSNHKQRLAVDFNAFDLDGNYLTTTEEYAPLGEYWQALDIDCCWGGEFGDGNHFSFKYGGMR